MQFGKNVKGSAVLLAACCVSNCFVATFAHTPDQEAPVDKHFTPYVSAVRTQNEASARAALIAKLRQLRDDLRTYALIARGGKMTDEQRASANVLKSIKENISTLLAKSPGTNVDPQDNSQLDPMLFELGSN